MRDAVAGPSPTRRRVRSWCSTGAGSRRRVGGRCCRPAPPVRLALDDDPVDASSPGCSTRRPAGTSTWSAPSAPGGRRRRLVNQHGELTETTTANLALRIGGRWWTPPTTSGCLPGIERGRLLELGRLHERLLHVDDLEAADQLAVLSSLRGWRRARLLGGQLDVVTVESTAVSSS